MHILVTGGTGFIGTALLPALIERGDTLTVLTRQSLDDSAAVRYINKLTALEGPVDAVINLAGASLADKRWSESYKAELRRSRLETTAAIGEMLAARGLQPSVMLSASAIGYYGPRGDEQLDEQAEPGRGFASQLCQDWEAAARAACPGETRLCLLRLGVVFDRDGGAYPQMALPFRLRFGNWIGDGTQWLSWVHRSDVVGAMRYLLDNAQIEGPVNLTAPEPTSSRGFCRAMQSQHRSLVKLPMPAALMRLAMGEMADELLITGQRVVPGKLLEAGYTFRYPTLDSALQELESAA
jgi:uncharacterized protein (TIGR01777 family)